MTSPHSALENLLGRLDAGRDVSAAAVHGMWSGRLAASPRPDCAGCWAYTMRMLGGTGVMSPELDQAFRKVLEYVASRAAETDFDFDIWLPAEEQPVRIRLQALREWCQGYLEGLVSVAGTALERISEDTRELIEDLMAVGEVDAEVEESEGSEKHLTELTEFVRVAAQHIQLDMLRAEAARAGAENGGPTLH